MSHLVYLPAYFLRLSLPPSVLRSFGSAHLYLIASPLRLNMTLIWAVAAYRHVELMDFIQSMERLVWARSKSVLRN